MLKPTYTNKFKKELEKNLKSGKDKNKIKVIIQRLANQEQLEAKHKDHKLIGNYKDRRVCHIEPDWLLIYKLTDNEIIFERTGSHAELFK